MEPRPHERGNKNRSFTGEPFLTCFNGATSSRTWKHGVGLCYFAANGLLQWSHALSNVETRERTSIWTSNGPALQWSHVLTNVETRRRGEDDESRQHASMEPRPHE